MQGTQGKKEGSEQGTEKLLPRVSVESLCLTERGRATARRGAEVTLFGAISLLRGPAPLGCLRRPSRLCLAVTS